MCKTVLVLVTGLNDNTFMTYRIICPNLVSRNDDVTIRVEGIRDQTEEINLTVYNVFGGEQKIQYSARIEKQDGWTVRFPAGSLTPAVYFFILTQSQYKVAGKIVVQ